LPLSERARIEVYLPDAPSMAYRNLLLALDREFTYTFGGCTINRGLDGRYLSRIGLPLADRINLLYSDTPFALDKNFHRIARYADSLRAAALEALDEEAILVVLLSVYHSE